MDVSRILDTLLKSKFNSVCWGRNPMSGKFFTKMLASVSLGVSFLFLAMMLLGVTGVTPVLADTPVPSPINSDDVWGPSLYGGNPYLVTGTVLVQAKLTILPGTEVKFAKDGLLQIGNGGQLLAIGSPAQPITFTSRFTKARGIWDGIRFVATSLTGTIQYAVIEYSRVGVELAEGEFHDVSSNTFRYIGDALDPSNSGVIVGSPDNNILNYNIVYSSVNGLRLKKPGDNQIIGNRIYDIDHDCLAFVSSSASSSGGNYIYDNEIFNCGDRGITLDDSGTGTYNQLVSNAISNTQDDAISLSNQRLFTITDNVVYSIPYVGVNGVSFSGFQGQSEFHNNAICVDDQYEINNTTGLALPANGNWLGTNTPTNPPEFSNNVNVNPTIILSVTPTDPALPADGVSTTVITITMNDGQGHVVPPLARTVHLETSIGTLSAPSVTLDANGEASVTLTSSTTPGTAIISATEFCNYVVTTTVQFQDADVAISKIGPGGTVRPGETVTYTIVYSNIGSIRAENVVITDISPITGGVVTLLSGVALDPGERHSLEYVVTTNPSICGGDYLTNVAYISTTSLENITYNNVATATNPPQIEGCYDLGITKSTPYAWAVPGQIITYTIAYTNASDYPAPGVIITDALPQYTTYSGDTSGLPATVGAGVVTWTVTPDPLPPHSGNTFILTATIGVTAGNLIPNPGLITNTVYIWGSGNEIATTNNSDSAVILLNSGVDLVTIKNDGIGAGDPRPFVRTGEIFTYTISVNNMGNEPARNVLLTDTLPAHTIFDPAHSTPGWTTSDGVHYTIAIPDLAGVSGGVSQGFVAHLAVLVASSLPCNITQLVNSAFADSDGPELYYPDNTSFDTTPVECQPMLLTKTTTLSYACPGDIVDYTIIAANNDAVSTVDQTLLDRPDAHTFFAGPPTWNGPVGGVYTYALGALDPNQQQSVPFSVWVDPNLASTVLAINNEVTLSPAGLTAIHTLLILHDVPDLYTVKNDNIEMLPDTLQAIARIERKTGPLPWLDALKDQSRAIQAHSVTPGDVISYSIAYGNAGPDAATNVRVVETLPDNTQFWGPMAPYWTHLGGNTYVYTVGNLAPGMGGLLEFRVKVDDPFPAGVPGVTNTVTIAGDDLQECSLDNNTSVEFTPVKRRGPTTIYLPIILKNWPPPDPVAQLSWIDQNNDDVSELDGAAGLATDGRNDGSFELTVDTGLDGYSRTITWIELSSSQSGTPRWNTSPNDTVPVMAVYLGGSRLNSTADGSVNHSLNNQETYTLYLSDDAGYTRFVCDPPLYDYTVTIHFEDGSSATDSADIPDCTVLPPVYAAWVSDVAADPTSNQVFIGGPRDHAVHVIDGSVDDYDRAVGVDNQPTGLAVLTSTTPSKVAVGHFTTNSPTWERGIWFINTSNLSAHPMADQNGYVGVRPAKVAANSQTGRFYISNYDDRMAIVNGVFETRLNWVNKTYQRPYGLKFNQSSNILYQATIDTGQMIVVDGLQAEISGYDPCHNPLPDITTPDQADQRILRMVAVNPNTGHIFVTSPPDPNPDNGQIDSRVYVLDEAAFLSAIGGRPSAATCGAVLGMASQFESRSIAAEPGVGWIARINLGITNAGTEGIAVNPVTNKVYVTDGGGNRVFVFQDGDSGSLSLPPWTITGFENPQGIAVNPATNKIYVANARATGDAYGIVLVIDGATDTVIKVIRLDGGGTLPLP